MNDDRKGPSGDRLWPTLIVAGLLLVMAVNFTYIWIAVNGADEVVPSYMLEER
jgi:hypothetical protein